MSNRITISDLYKNKKKSKIVTLTCYTAPIAKILDNHVDILLVGDSLGMTVYGHNNTLAVTKRMMIDHGKCVVDNSKNALVVIDLPFGSYETDKIRAFDTAAEIISKTNANAVKLEGGKEISETIINLFDDTVNTSSKTLLKLLAENKRLKLISSISEIYQQLLEKHNKQKSIKVFVAKDPSEEAKINIEEKLKSSYGKDANISFSKDPNIMGGLSIKIGDETLDLSIRGKVKKLINQLNF